ncbi:MAG: hypothetical protein FWF20_06165 [Betaproteobacteria bacterium]|nr:hypothetical protein [Betaproteobacteria bacterium]MCL2886357.1 hypothetical protein [Betaproteobacteria bacterium]
MGEIRKMVEKPVLIRGKGSHDLSYSTHAKCSDLANDNPMLFFCVSC